METLDTAFYQCVVSNGVDTIESTAVVKVNLGSGGGGNRPGKGWSNYDDYDDEGLLPETYSQPGMGFVTVNLEFRLLGNCEMSYRGKTNDFIIGES